MFKIISKRKYDVMQRHITSHHMQIAEKECEIEKLTAQNKDLRDNCKELYDEVKRIEKELAEVEKQLAGAEMKSLNDYCIVKTSDYPCDKCNLECDFCKKLHFSNQTICVVPKEKVNSFRKKSKK